MRARRVSRRAQRPKRCPFCNRDMKSASGRPRTSCGRLQCKAALKRSQRAERGGKWNGEDWLEAISTWHHRCSRCGRQTKLEPKLRLTVPILPVCATCKQKPVGAKARRWLGRVAWGVPLPNPNARLAA